jgi:hypothetical protein
MNNIESLGYKSILFLYVSIILIFAIFAFLLWFGWWVSQKRGSMSPYSKKPMMYGVDLPKSIGRQVEEYLKSLPQPENPPFDCDKAAICRETGRIFPNAVLRGEIIMLKWDFLKKRYPGNWVSWGSLTELQKGMIRLSQYSLDDYQTKTSSPRPMPQDVDQFYAYTKPGPLYVDITSKILLGWQVVPGTYFEVLVVQKPQYQTIDETL